MGSEAERLILEGYHFGALVLDTEVALQNATRLVK